MRAGEFSRTHANRVRENKSCCNTDGPGGDRGLRVKGAVMARADRLNTSFCAAFGKYANAVVAAHKQNLCKAIWRIRVIGESVKQKAAGD